MTAMRSLALLTLALGASTLRSDEKEISREDFDKAVPIFLAKPGAAEGKAAAKTIRLHATQNRQVLVHVGVEEGEWWGDPDHPYLDRLVAAYYLGSLQYQIKEKVKRHNVHTGVAVMLQVYKALQMADRDYKIEGMEKLLTMQKEKKLDAFLEKIQKERDELLKDPSK